MQPRYATGADAATGGPEGRVKVSVRSQRIFTSDIWHVRATGSAQPSPRGC